MLGYGFCVAKSLTRPTWLANFEAESSQVGWATVFSLPTKTSNGSNSQIFAGGGNKWWANKKTFAHPTWLLSAVEGSLTRLMRFAKNAQRILRGLNGSNAKRGSERVGCSFVFRAHQKDGTHPPGYLPSQTRVLALDSSSMSATECFHLLSHHLLTKNVLPVNIFIAHISPSFVFSCFL